MWGNRGADPSSYTFSPETLARLREIEKRTPRAPMNGQQGYGAERKAKGDLSRPAWFSRSLVPLVVVCGPPGAGKSTYVAAHAGPDDLVICYDQIAAELFGAAGPRRATAGLGLSQVARVLNRRNQILSELMKPAAAGRWPKAWLIVSEPKAADRMWWAEKTGAQVIVLAVPADECRRRAALDAARGDDRGPQALAYVSTWWCDYSPAACDMKG